MSESPYRIPAPPPAPPKPPPPRAWTILFYGLIAFICAGSYEACEQTTSKAVANVMGPITVVATVALLTAAIYVFAKHARTSTATSVIGIVLSLAYGAAALFFDIFFWSEAARSTTGFGLGFGAWGRPLRVDGRALTPSVRASDEWAHGPRPDPASLDPQTRAVLRELWLHDARKEHASVPAFGQVARQLVVLGAPSELVRRAHLSALQEIDHAERCFALASTFAGEDLGVQAMPDLAGSGGELPGDRARALAQVATEALVDGALLEDFNAELARTALVDVRDPAAREALVRIVEDEADHARLAWDIIRYCVREGGKPVAEALTARFAKVEDRIDSMYDPALVAMVAALPDPEPLHAFGRVRPSRVDAVYRERRAHVTAELTAILAAHPRATVSKLSISGTAALGGSPADV